MLLPPPVLFASGHQHHTGPSGFAVCFATKRQRHPVPDAQPFTDLVTRASVSRYPLIVLALVRSARTAGHNGAADGAMLRRGQSAISYILLGTTHHHEPQLFAVLSSSSTSGFLIPDPSDTACLCDFVAVANSTLSAFDVMRRNAEHCSHHFSPSARVFASGSMYERFCLQ